MNSLKFMKFIIKFDTNVFAIFIMFSNTYFSLYSANMLLNMKRLNCSNSKKEKKHKYVSSNLCATSLD